MKHGEQPIGTVTLRWRFERGSIEPAPARKRCRRCAGRVAGRPPLSGRLRAQDQPRRRRADGFDIGAELATAQSIATAAKGGKNPFIGKTGGFERHYLLDAADEIMPYRVYVPTAYNGTPRISPDRRAPRAWRQRRLVHGFATAKTVPALAEERGYIVVSPLGYRVDGFYGFNLPTTRRPADRRRVALSERDVMEVLKRVRADYKVDESRIYLMGHSMGAIGTWAIAAKYPTIWAALAAFAGLGNPRPSKRCGTSRRSSCTATPIPR